MNRLIELHQQQALSTTRAAGVLGEAVAVICALYNNIISFAGQRGVITDSEPCFLQPCSDLLSVRTCCFREREREREGI